ncbi:MAG: hypothetical protein IJD86_13405 [Clostridia bacterium]|nr:hypothetical protein [Clostridia bacterium]
MSNIIKSLFVFVFVLYLGFLCFFAARYAIRNIRRKVFRSVLCAFVFLLLLPVTLFLANYINPFDRNVELKLYEVVEQDKMLNVYNGSFKHSWYGVYKWRVSIDGNCDEPDSRWNLDYLDCKKVYDYTKHSYIVSFGCEIDSLKYNVWEHHGIPMLDLGTSYKWGIVEFSDDIDPTKIYIYEIPRMYIDRNKLGKDEYVPYNFTEES